MVAARFWSGVGMLSNFARNSPLSRSNIELASLELQRFWRILKSDRDKLRAKFIWRLSHRCAWSSAAGSTNPSAPEAMGVLHYTKPAGGVSPACRASNGAIPPFGGAVIGEQVTHGPRVAQFRTIGHERGA